jgi:hypothetical protein
MNISKSLITFGLAIYLVNSVGCGVLLYPERQGQKSGKIDPVVVILDGIGLLFFVIPGLVAFAIDFHQGTIYLANGATSGVLNNEKDGIAIKVDGPMTKENIEKALHKATGLTVDLSAENVQVTDITHQQGDFARTLASGNFYSTQL